VAALTSLPVLRTVALLLAALAPALHAAEWRVHAGESLPAAVAHAAPGDRLLIERGRYAGPVRIDKPLTLQGIDRPTVSGGLHGDTIRVTAPDVTLQGLIVSDSGDDLGAQNAGVYVEPGADRITIANCQIAYNLFGLWVQGVKEPHITGNVIVGKRDLPSAQRGNGIQLYNTTGAQIVGNEISFSRDGIYVDVSQHAVFRGNRIHDVRYGTHYMNSNDNVWEGNESFHNRGGLALMETRRQVVRNNIAWGNSDHGIMLRTIQDSVIEGNIVAGNQRGFFVYDAEFNTLRHNLVVGNDVGMHVWAGSIHNEVDDNDFISNQEQVRYIATHDEPWGGRNGNYWSNYLGWDRDSDGRGDVAYRASDSMDRLLWRYPAAKLLLNSPAVQTLRLVSEQFPLLQAPSVVDPHPRMLPQHRDWTHWLHTQ
jgi:nitrous oxidase accessory protein